MKILIIQTAFIGDVILATSLVEKLHAQFPQAEIDFLLRKGNESLLAGHPVLRKVLIWDKKQHKYPGLFQLLAAIRQSRYDLVVNCQRFAASGFLTALSGAKETTGFQKNPFSMFFSKRLPHQIGDGVHEVARNHTLIAHLAGDGFALPRLYPSEAAVEKVRRMAGEEPYICLAPTSVWFTKQWPAHKWAALMDRMPQAMTIYLLGSKADAHLCDGLLRQARHGKVINLAGQLTFLESAALMQRAAMNYVNDSGPMHLASAMDAPVVAIFCSTVPSFGFGPLSTRSFIVETTATLPCRPCGLHGYKACPEGHFACAEGIAVEAVRLPETVGF